MHDICAGPSDAHPNLNSTKEAENESGNHADTGEERDEQEESGDEHAEQASADGDDAADNAQRLIRGSVFDGVGFLRSAKSRGYSWSADNTNVLCRGVWGSIIGVRSENTSDMLQSDPRSRMDRDEIGKRLTPLGSTTTVVAQSSALLKSCHATLQRYVEGQHLLNLQEALEPEFVRAQQTVAEKLQDESRLAADWRQVKTGGIISWCSYLKTVGDIGDTLDRLRLNRVSTWLPLGWKFIRDLIIKDKIQQLKDADENQTSTAQLAESDATISMRASLEISELLKELPKCVTPNARVAINVARYGNVAPMILMCEWHHANGNLGAASVMWKNAQTIVDTFNVFAGSIHRLSDYHTLFTMEARTIFEDTARWLACHRSDDVNDPQFQALRYAATHWVHWKVSDSDGITLIVPEGVSSSDSPVVLSIRLPAIDACEYFQGIDGAAAKRLLNALVKLGYLAQIDYLYSNYSKGASLSRAIVRHVAVVRLRHRHDLQYPRVKDVILHHMLLWTGLAIVELNYPMVGMDKLYSLQETAFDNGAQCRESILGDRDFSHPHDGKRHSASYQAAAESVNILVVETPRSVSLEKFALASKEKAGWVDDENVTKLPACELAKLNFMVTVFMWERFAQKCNDQPLEVATAALDCENPRAWIDIGFNLWSRIEENYNHPEFPWELPKVDDVGTHLIRIPCITLFPMACFHNLRFPEDSVKNFWHGESSVPTRVQVGGKPFFAKAYMSLENTRTSSKSVAMNGESAAMIRRRSQRLLQTSLNLHQDIDVRVTSENVRELFADDASSKSKAELKKMTLFRIATWLKRSTCVEKDNGEV